MKRLSGRQRLLIGALVVAGAIAAVDRFTGSRAPVPARGDQASPAAAPANPAGWNEVDALVSRLTRSDYASVASEIEQLPRDIFVPSVIVSPVVSAAEAAPPAGAPESQPVEPQPDFRSQHRLSGVLLGETPLAVVDDQLVALAAQVDGLTLVEIARDYVVFQRLGDETRVVLELAQRPKNP